MTTQGQGNRYDRGRDSPRDRGRGGRPGGPPPRSPNTLPSGYLEGGYFDEQGNLRPDAVTTWARQIAKVLADGNMGAAQLRNFFGTLRLLEQRARSGTPFDALKAGIARLESQAAASVGRNNAPEVFFLFVERNVKLAQQNRQAFDAFVAHFEAIVAYLTYLKPSEGRDRGR